MIPNEDQNMIELVQTCSNLFKKSNYNSIDLRKCLHNAKKKTQIESYEKEFLINVK